MRKYLPKIPNTNPAQLNIQREREPSSHQSNDQAVPIYAQRRQHASTRGGRLTTMRTRIYALVIVRRSVRMCLVLYARATTCTLSEVLRILFAECELCREHAQVVFML